MDAGLVTPSGSTLYGVTGKLYRYLAKFAGEDPDAAEQAYHESMAEVTGGANPVEIGEALGDGIDLGLSLTERRRALREYHDEVARRELAPPAYDTERIEDEDGALAGLRLLVSEPGCRFFMRADRDVPEVLVVTPDGGTVPIPLEFEPGAVEPVDAAETVTEAIVHRAEPDADVDEDAGEDGPTYADEILDAAREVVLDDPGRALLAAETDEGPGLGILVSKLLDREPRTPSEDAATAIKYVIRRVGMDALEERYDELVAEPEPTGEPESDDDPAGWRAVGNERVHRTRDCQYLKQAHEVEPVDDPQGPRCSRCWSKQEDD